MFTSLIFSGVDRKTWDWKMILLIARWSLNIVQQFARWSCCIKKILRRQISGFWPKYFPRRNKSWLDLVETLILTVIAKLLSPHPRASTLKPEPEFHSWNILPPPTPTPTRHLPAATCGKLFCNFWMFLLESCQNWEHFRGNFWKLGRHQSLTNGYGFETQKLLLNDLKIYLESFWSCNVHIVHLSLFYIGYDLNDQYHSWNSKFGVTIH